MTEPMLDTNAVAELLGVTASTVRGYNKNKTRSKATHPFHEADNRIGASPVWKRSTIVEWDESRPSRQRAGAS